MKLVACLIIGIAIGWYGFKIIRRKRYSWTCPSCKTETPINQFYCRMCGHVTEGVRYVPKM